MSPTQPRYYVTFLRSELQRRAQKNPRYSLRAFAHAIDLHPSALSRIMHSKQELSIAACIKIIPKFAITEQEKHDFLSSVVEEKVCGICDLFARALGVEIRIPFTASQNAS